MKNKLGTILKRMVFAFGIIYGIDVVLNSVNIYVPINIATIAITSILGVPGLMSIFAILLMLN